jgi:hypothetical protein
MLHRPYASLASVACIQLQCQRNPCLYLRLEAWVTSQQLTNKQLHRSYIVDYFTPAVAALGHVI